MNIRKMIKEEIKKLKLKEEKLRPGQQVWIRHKEDPDFVKGWVLTNNQIRTRQYDLVDYGGYDKRYFEVRTEDPGPGPHGTQKSAYEKEQERIRRFASKLNKLSVSGDRKDRPVPKEIERIAKQFATSNDGEEYGHSDVYDLAQNMYHDYKVRQYLDKIGMTDKNDAYEHLTNIISNYL